MSKTTDSYLVTSSGPQSYYNSAKTLLSAREWEVLERTGCGLSAKDIARELFISIHTVQVHNRAIKKKLALKGYRAIVGWYQQNKPK
jgi:DNA-binding NarL/FixJ family response regulator